MHALKSHNDGVDICNCFLFEEKYRKCLFLIFLSEDGIDEERFHLLDEATINWFIPRAGPILKFLKKIVSKDFI